VMTLEEMLDSLRCLHDWMRELLVSACERCDPLELSEVVHDGAGDVTFMVDRVSETALVDWLTREIAVREPIVLIGKAYPRAVLLCPTRRRPMKPAGRSLWILSTALGD
jgi:hypothetical protein